MSNRSIRPIDRTLSDATTPGQSRPGSDGNKGIFRILQNSSITRASPLDCFASYQDTRRESLTSLQWCSRCILQPQPNGTGNKEVLYIPKSFKVRALSSDCLVSYIGHSLGGVSPLCRDNIGIFYSINEASPSDCLVSYTGHSLGGVVHLCRDTVGVCYSPSRLGLVGGVLPHYRYAVGIYYSHSQLGHNTLE